MQVAFIDLGLCEIENLGLRIWPVSQVDATFVILTFRSPSVKMERARKSLGIFTCIPVGPPSYSFVFQETATPNGQNLVY